MYPAMGALMYKRAGEGMVGSGVGGSSSASASPQDSMQKGDCAGSEAVDSMRMGVCAGSWAAWACFAAFFSARRAARSVAFWALIFLMLKVIFMRLVAGWRRPSRASAMALRISAITLAARSSLQRLRTEVRFEKSCVIIVRLKDFVQRYNEKR